MHQFQLPEIILRIYQSEWQNAIRNMFQKQDIPTFYKQLQRMTKYKDKSKIPNKVKKNGELALENKFEDEVI